MRHNRDEKRFDRTVGHLRCMLANMTNDLISNGRIKTTTERAKVLRRYAEKMITLGKDGTTAARRRAMAFMRNKIVVTKLFNDVAPQFKERNGGYTRIMKLGVRPGDAASMSIIELVEGAGAKAEVKPKAAKKAPAKKAPAKKTAEAAAPKAKKAAAPKAEKAEKTAKAPKKAAEKKEPATKRAKKEPAEKA